MVETMFNAEEEALAQAAAEVFAKAAQEVLARKDYVVIALPGGNSPLMLFSVLQGRDDIDWKKIHFFMLDERLVDLESDDSNFRQVYEHFFIDLVEAKKISWRNLHPFIYKPQDVDSGVSGYAQELEAFGGSFDIVIAGVGEDGHTAALFPHHEALASNELFVTFNDSPKPPAGRMSASVGLIQHATHALVLFIGDNKAEAYWRFMDESVDWHECPAKILQEVKELYVVTTLTKQENKKTKKQ